MNPKFNIGDKVYILNMREMRHNIRIGTIIEVEYHGEPSKKWKVEDKYFYNVRMFVNNCEYRYWRAEEFLEMVEMKKESVKFT